MSPVLSIILPIYNRKRFLEQAIGSIRSQAFEDWELIVVDDGSTDGPRGHLERLLDGATQPARYVYQENQGPYAARNTGVDMATGEYIAFFDSDDYWLPHHLSDCVAALGAHPDVDRVGGACRRVEASTGRVLTPNTFFDGDVPRPFLKLRTRDEGPLRIIDDPDAVRCAILHGVHSGLQSTVARRRIFEEFRFRSDLRNEAEDVLFAIRLLARGRRIGFFENVHVLYYVHEEHSSAASAGGGIPLDRQTRIFSAIAQGYEELRHELELAPAESRALDQRLAQLYFWCLGYPLLLQGRVSEAMTQMRKGLRLDPTWPPYWKTYLLTAARGLLIGRDSTTLVDRETPSRAVAGS